MPGRKSKKTARLKQLELKLNIIKKEINRRKSGKKRKIETPRSSRASKKQKTPVGECLKILHGLQKLKIGSHFLNPVDPEKENIPHYREWIDSPMDFSTIEKKLENKEYSNMYEFARDVHLTLANAQLFNGIQTLIGKDSNRILNRFEESFSKLVEMCETSRFTKSLVLILSPIMRTADSAIFRQPVRKIQKVEGYFEIIKKPMDLGTIYDRIHLYDDFKSFMDDIMLVWTNAMTFNPKGNVFHGYADKFKSSTERFALRYLPEEFDRYQRGTPSQIRGEPSTLDMQYSLMEKLILEEEKEKEQKEKEKEKLQKSKSKLKQSKTKSPSATIITSSLANGPSNINTTNNINPPLTLPSMAAEPSQAQLAAQAAQAQLSKEGSMDVSPDSTHLTQTQSETISQSQTNESGESLPPECYMSLEDIDEKYDEEEVARIIRVRFFHKDVSQFAIVNENGEVQGTKIDHLDYEQQTELQKGVFVLDSERLAPLADTLHRLADNNGSNMEEIELEIDTIEPKTQVEMYIYVCQAIKVMEEERIEREKQSRTSIIDTSNINIIKQSQLQAQKELQDIQQYELQQQQQQQQQQQMIGEQSQENGNMNGNINGNVSQQAVYGHGITHSTYSVNDVPTPDEPTSFESSLPIVMPNGISNQIPSFPQLNINFDNNNNININNSSIIGNIINQNENENNNINQNDNTQQQDPQQSQQPVALFGDMSVTQSTSVSASGSPVRIQNEQNEQQNNNNENNLASNQFESMDGMLVHQNDNQNEHDNVINMNHNENINEINNNNDDNLNSNVNLDQNNVIENETENMDDEEDDEDEDEDIGIVPGLPQLSGIEGVNDQNDDIPDVLDTNQ